MSTGHNNPDNSLVHVHVCLPCGAVVRREDFEDHAHTTGLYLCPKCGVEGPLNIEIRQADNLDQSGRND